MSEKTPIRRCESCESSKTPCSTTPPATSVSWGHAEFVQLGDYWMHVSTVDRSHPSYGSALSAYESALARAATDDQVASARQGHLAAWRCSLAQTQEGREHARAAPVDGCRCPVCLDAAVVP